MRNIGQRDVRETLRAFSRISICEGKGSSLGCIGHRRHSNVGKLLLNNVKSKSLNCHERSKIEGAVHGPQTHTLEAQPQAGPSGLQQVQGRGRRLGETSDQREERLRLQRERTRARRERETSTERATRQEADRLRARNRRERESILREQLRVGNERELHRVAPQRGNSEFEEFDPNNYDSVRLRRNERDVARRYQSGAVFMFEGFTYDPNFDYANQSIIQIGGLDRICRFCSAKCFRHEAPGICCSKGKVVCDPIEYPPEPVKSLFTDDYPEANHFRQYILRYNSCFLMTSMGVTREVRHDHFNPTFMIQGQIHHRIGSLLPPPESEPQFLQIYFVGDSDNQIDVRTGIFSDLRRGIVANLQVMLDQNNHLIRSFKTCLERMPSDQHRLVLRADRTPPGEHRGRYNAPTTEEIAAIIIDGPASKRDIVIQRRDQRLQRISETHPYYDALQYPLIFWRGDQSYHINIFQRNSDNNENRAKKISCMDYYAYQFMIRDETRNFLFHCGFLLNQFAVDMFAKVESERLSYIRFHQSELRAESYIHLRDAVANDIAPDDIGQRFILPSTYIGSPRHMHEYAQDALTYVRKYGRPDLFLTMTCNPKWPEITENLIGSQSNIVRHDIVARVFRQKLIKLIDLMTKYKLFGDSRCFMYSIEWQKRGLPHAHILLWLKERIRPERIDDVISAEIPDAASDPILFDVVTRHMIHGPCGALNPRSICMSNNKCTKRYPRPFVSETISDQDGYPLYRRRSVAEGGRCFYHNDELELDNRWVVPYSPILSKIFRTHLNVEYCHSVKSIKYICKYINKGSDMALIQVENSNRNDEISQYQLGRYLSTSEAFWRIFGFPIHDRFPAVMHLHIHLENGQRVYFRPDQAANVAQNPPKTTLTAFLTFAV